MNQAEILNYLKGQKITRNINALIVHCSATTLTQEVNVEIIDKWHKDRGFAKQPGSGHYCGYHFLVLQDGTIQPGRYIDEIGAHVSGSNSNSIGICYAGGISNGKASDTRTPAQKNALIWLIMQLLTIFPNSDVKGHRDCSPDKDGDGIIEKHEWIKECPCFDVMQDYKSLNYR